MESHSHERGQTLLLSLAIFCLLGLLMFLMINIGRVIVEKERLRARTDVVAFAGGVDYARSLNLVAVSNKVLGVAIVASICGSILSLGTSFTIPYGIQKGQDIFAGTGNLSFEVKGLRTDVGIAPYATQASMLQLGAANGLLVVPLWNTEKLTRPSDLLKVGPNLNLSRRGIDFGALQRLLETIKENWSEFAKIAGDTIKKVAPGLWNTLGKMMEDKFTFKDHKSGEIFEVDAESVTEGPNPSNESKKSHRSQTQEHGSKYVKKEASNKFKKNLGLDLIGDDGHNITIISTNSSSLPLPGFIKNALNWVKVDVEPATPPHRFFKPIPIMTGISKVCIGGGTVDVFKFEKSGSYAPYFVPVNEDPNDLFKVETSLAKEKGDSMIWGFVKNFTGKFLNNLADQFINPSMPNLKVLH